MRQIGDAILSLQRWAAGILPEPWEVRTDLEAGLRVQRPHALVEAPTADATTGPPTQRMIAFNATINMFLAKAASREAARDAALALRALVQDAIDWGDPHQITTGYIPLWAYDPRLEVQRVSVRDAIAGTWRLQYNGQWTARIPVNGMAADVQAALAPLDAGFQAQDRAGQVFDIYFAGDMAGSAPPLLGLDTSGLVLGRRQPFVKEISRGQAAPWRAPSDFMTVTGFGQNTIHDQTDETLAMVAVDLRLTFAKARPLWSNRRILERVTATDGSPI